VTLELTTNVESIFDGRQRDDGLFYAIDFTLAEIKRLTAHERTDHSGEAVFPNRYNGDAIHFEIPTLAEEIELVDALNAKTVKSAGIYI
jgi:glycerophosphoryl diester phosphodiesterase